MESVVYGREGNSIRNKRLPTFVRRRGHESFGVARTRLGGHIFSSPMVRFAFRRLVVVISLAGAVAQAADLIDRHALVTRHNPHLTTVDPWAPLSVGNGEFC